MSVMQEAVDHYKYLLTLNDKRVENWLLLKDPTPSIYIAVAYLAFCFAAPRVLFKLTLSGRVRAINAFLRKFFGYPWPKT